MRALTQQQINVGLFDEVKRLRQALADSEAERERLRGIVEYWKQANSEVVQERDKLQNRLAGTLAKGGHDGNPALVVERLRDRLIAKAGESVEQAALRVVLESDRRRSDNQKLREDLDSERAMNAKLTEEGDTLRAQLAESDAELSKIKAKAFSRVCVGSPCLVSRTCVVCFWRERAKYLQGQLATRTAERDSARLDRRDLADRLAAYEPVIEAVRELQRRDGSSPLSAFYVRDRVLEIPLPAKVTT